ncbi:MAG: outer membrane protein assembly factor BamD [Flavobacteriales bacterium]|nr:outer membrane protein assembly factor BamD [Flavobacteriales bacterium]
MFLALFGALLAGCSDYYKAMKSDDLDLKLATADTLFRSGKYERAIPLLEELSALTRGTSISERVQYYLAKSYFGMKDYTLGGFYLATFTKTFPTSRYAEECAFLAAYCFYKNSPDYELDQGDTQAALDALQLFLVRYPASDRKDTCNALIDVLRDKLERKDYAGAEQYVQLRNYQAAGLALDEFLKRWPNSRFREEAMFLMLTSAQKLAAGSVPAKKEQRLREAIRTYHNFADAFSESRYLAEAKRMEASLEAQLDQITKGTIP